VKNEMEDYSSDFSREKKSGIRSSEKEKRTLQFSYPANFLNPIDKVSLEIIIPVAPSK